MQDVRFIQFADNICKYIYRQLSNCNSTAPHASNTQQKRTYPSKSQRHANFIQFRRTKKKQERPIDPCSKHMDHLHPVTRFRFNRLHYSFSLHLIPAVVANVESPSCH